MTYKCHSQNVDLMLCLFSNLKGLTDVYDLSENKNTFCRWHIVAHTARTACMGILPEVCIRWCKFFGEDFPVVVTSMYE